MFVEDASVTDLRKLAKYFCQYTQLPQGLLARFIIERLIQLQRFLNRITKPTMMTFR